MSHTKTAISRQELHVLVDHIPDSEVLAARKILRALIDPVELALLTAPPDDEPLTAHEMAATEVAAQREQRGESLVSHEEILREFGLSETEG